MPSKIQEIEIIINICLFLQSFIKAFILYKFYYVSDLNKTLNNFFLP